MPEYLAPGVYVEETSFRPKTIEGVATSTTGFAGVTRFGPARGEPELLTSLSQFERIYGGLDRIQYDGSTELITNYLAQAVRAFFEEGGTRLYVSRVYDGDEAVGRATGELGAGSPGDLALTARHPGRGGEMRVTLTLRHTDNILVVEDGVNVLRRVREHDTVALYQVASPETVEIYDVVLAADGESLELEGGGETEVLNGSPPLALNPGDKLVQLTVDVEIERPIDRPTRPTQKFASGEAYEGLAFHPGHNVSLTTVFPESTDTRRVILYNPLIVTTDETTGAGLVSALFGDAGLDGLADSIAGRAVDVSDLQLRTTLDNGSDGTIPEATDFAGTEEAGVKSGILALEDLEGISIVAAPGSSALADDTNNRAAQSALITHATRMRYRIAVLDTPSGQTLGDVREFRGQFDSKYTAMYFPWIRVLDPITEEELSLPPSGFVTGIYVRNDVNVGVHKTPANEVVRLAVGFEQLLNKAQQDVLNPDGLNCFRFFEGRGYRLWGGRTISSDGGPKYVSTRRYLAYLEASIDRGTQVFVFENNGPKLWNNVQQTVGAFLFNEWKSGRLLGFTPEQAYFVRCGLDTMTQNDLDNGRLICEIGVSLLKPAEFVIFRIGQKLLNS